MPSRRTPLLGILAGALALLAACTSGPAAGPASPSPAATGSASRSPSGSPSPTNGPNDLPGMPPLLDPKNVYAADGPNMLSPQVRGDLPYVYVPNVVSNEVDVIDQRTYQIVGRFPGGDEVQHVVPSYDLKTLWVNADASYTLTPIDPRTAKPGTPVRVADPYNLYFTPDGKYALVMAEALQQIIWSDPKTMQPVYKLRVPCPGVNHADFSLDGRYFIATCEFGNALIKVDTLQRRVIGKIVLPVGSKPQDVRVAPDGAVFYAADMIANGVWVVDGQRFVKTGFIPTGKGAHGLYPSRDAKTLYVTNRDEGSISLLDFASRSVVGKWRIPGGGSPDMGGLNAAGTILWLSGRYNSEVYAISTSDGSLIRRIRVGTQPHGLLVWPQPGRYSLGHTGNMR